MNPKTLRVLSYNIHKGFSATKLRFSLNRMKISLQRVHADLVFLQEVLGRHDKRRRKIADWPTTAQFEYLADKIWPHVAYGKNAVYDAGHHGNAILSKHPILSMENLDISHHRLEHRGLLHASIAFPGHKKPVHAICMHLGLFESGRRVQVDRLCERIAAAVPRTAPLVVAGDFNDWRERISPVLKKRLGLEEAFMSVNGEHARTFPCWHPLLRLDRIYVRGLKIRAVRTFTGKPWNRLSDHAAVYAELGF